MHKRKLHHILVRLRVVPAILFLFLAISFGVVSIFALRANNQKMIELREAVYVADEQNGDVEGALRALRQHVHTHMNTSLTAGDNSIRPPVQLKYTYERLAEAEQAKRVNNDGLITEAQNHCEQTQPQSFYGRGRLDCIRQYLDQHGVSVSDEINIPEDLYKFDFVSPKWSPDLAGWSLVLTVFFFVLFLVRAAAESLIKLDLEK